MRVSTWHPETPIPVKPPAVPVRLATLLRLYNVTTLEQLIDAQEKRIAELQAQLKVTP